MFRDIREYREVPCTRGYLEDRALVGEVVEGEHNMMADTGERRKEHSLPHMDFLELKKRKKHIDDWPITTYKSKFNFLLLLRKT